jgi:hypothetical protein
LETIADGQGRRMTASKTDEKPDGAAGTALSKRALGWTIAIIVGLAAWFLIVWLAMGGTLIDAAGESVGTGLVILLVISIVGAVRKR